LIFTGVVGAFESTGLGNNLKNADIADILEGVTEMARRSAGVS